VKTRTKK